MKSPHTQRPDDEAREQTEEFIAAHARKAAGGASEGARLRGQGRLGRQAGQTQRVATARRSRRAPLRCASLRQWRPWARRSRGSRRLTPQRSARATNRRRPRCSPRLRVARERGVARVEVVRGRDQIVLVPRRLPRADGRAGGRGRRGRGDRIGLVIHLTAVGRASGLELDTRYAHVWTMRAFRQRVQVDAYRDPAAALLGAGRGEPDPGRPQRQRQHPERDVGGGSWPTRSRRRCRSRAPAARARQRGERVEVGPESLWVSFSQSANPAATVPTRNDAIARPVTAPRPTPRRAERRTAPRRTRGTPGRRGRGSGARSREEDEDRARPARRLRHLVEADGPRQQRRHQAGDHQPEPAEQTVQVELVEMDQRGGEQSAAIVTTAGSTVRANAHSRRCVPHQDRRAPPSRRRRGTRR